MSQKPPPFERGELEAIRSSFRSELERALRGESRCVSRLVHRVNRKSLPDTGRCLCLVVGGTTLQTASASLEAGKLRIESPSSNTLPTMTSREIIFAILDDYLAADTALVGLNFAFPLSPEARGSLLDGRLIKGTKSHTMEGLVGTLVGESLENHARERGHGGISVAAANDTVCLILSAVRDHPPESIIGGVVGTGFNFGLYTDETTVVNLESGNFDGFEQSEAGRHIDQESDNPGSQRYEKEISGAYLYRHFNYYAAASGLTARIASTGELSALASGSGEEGRLARTIIGRAASLAAVQIAALCEFRNLPVMTVLVEGSVFWKSWRFRETVNETLTALGVDTARTNFIHIENSSVTGAACLAFLCS